MKKKYMPGLLICMIIAGLLFGASFHIILMPLFNGQLLHCLLSGLLFGLVNYFFAYFFFNRYWLLQIENKQLNNYAQVDQLTGIFNRRTFEKDIMNLDHNYLYSIFFIDIDNFGEFNNLYGHQVGDNVLSKVCKSLKSSIRSCDAVYRYGGEEFVIVLKDCKKSNALAIGEKIRKKISILDNSPFPPITVSVGVACTAGDGNGIIDIIKSADIAMLSAKKKGKNRVEVFDKSLSL